MNKTKLKKGTVKCIDRNELQVVILGPVDEQGKYFEKKVGIHCIEYFENDQLKTNAFEFLRKTIVGQKIEFEDYKIEKEINADLFFENKNLGCQLIEQGLARPIKMEEKEKNSKKFDDLEDAFKKAQQAKVGFFESGNLEDEDKPLNRKERRQNLKKKVKKNVEDLEGETFTGYIEDVSKNLVFEMWLPQYSMTVSAKFGWIKIPIIDYKHVTKLKNWMSKNIYQRTSTYKCLKIEDDVLHLVEVEGNCENLLLEKGWARLDREASENIPTVQLSKFHVTQEISQSKKLRIWKNWETKNQGKIIKSAKWPLKTKIEVTVMEVHNGDSITVQEKSGSTLRIFLTNIKAPKYDWRLAEKSDKWAFEARDFTRKALIKQVVTLELDVNKVVTLESKKELEIKSGTIFVGNKAFAVDLLAKGLASLNVKKGSSDISSALSAYSIAYDLGVKRKAGMHGTKYTPKSFWDYSLPENKKKLKTSNTIELGDERVNAIVERCMSASRFKLRVDSLGIFIIFSLSNIKSVRGNKNMSSLEKWALKGSTRANELISQRDVTIQIQKIDNSGTCHGNLFVGKKNFTKTVLKEGLVYIDASFGKSKNHDKMYALEQKAKAAKAGFWKDDLVVVSLGLKDMNDEDDEEENNSGEILESKSSSKKKSNLKTFTAVLSECDSAQEFYMQRSNTTQMKTIIKGIKEKARKCSLLEEPIEFGTFCIGDFEGEFHRCKVISKGPKGAFKVFFLDWGNYGYLKSYKLKTCPPSLMNISPQAKCIALDHIKMAGNHLNTGLMAIDYIQEMLADKNVTVKQTQKDPTYCIAQVYPKKSEFITQSLNYLLVREGLAVPDFNDQEVKSNPVWKEAYDAACIKNSTNIQEIEDEQ